MPDELATPVGWRVCAVDGRKQFVDGFRLEPFTWQFADQPAAEAKKLDCQRAGMVASVTPVYLSGYARRKARNKAQMAPLGRFNADWRLMP